jgi:hypothetical protein
MIIHYLLVKMGLFGEGGVDIGEDSR